MDKIICLGKNYMEHAKELGDTVPEKPVIFIKPPSCLHFAQTNNSPLTCNHNGYEVHYETEIVLKLRSNAYRVSAQEAEQLVESVTIGLDLTLRNLQTKLKQQGHPWELGKVFPQSAVVGNFLNVEEFKNWQTEKFSFELNGVKKQESSSIEMMLNVFDAVSYISQWIPLFKGDLIFTGTPSGVGAVKSGDVGLLNWGSIRLPVSWK